MKNEPAPRRSGPSRLAPKSELKKHRERVIVVDDDALFLESLGQNLVDALLARELQKHVDRALDELQFFSTNVKILGVYPAHPFRPEDL